jgi:hypothetical protein
MDVGNSVKNNSSDHITWTFPVVWCPGFMDVTPLFMQLSIIFSNQRFSNCSPTMDVGCVKLKLDSFCGNSVFKMYSVLLPSHLCCSSAVIFQNNASQCTISSYQCWFSLFLFTDVVFPWSVYANIALETVILNKPNNVAVFVTDAQANAHQQSVRFQNQTSLTFSDSFTSAVTGQTH